MYKKLFKLRIFIIIYIYSYQVCCFPSVFVHDNDSLDFIYMYSTFFGHISKVTFYNQWTMTT